MGWFLVGICIVTFALSGSKSNPFKMINNASVDEDALEKVMIKNGMQGSLQGRYFNRSFIAYWCKRHDEAVKWSDEYLKLATLCGFMDVYNSLYRGLAAFQLARSSSDAKWVEMGESSILAFEGWVKHSKWNMENKLLLLQAERSYVLGQTADAIVKYKSAACSAEEHRFCHEQGLALELLGNLYSQQGRVQDAKDHLAQARACYERWGANAILDLRTPVDSSE
jgi:tetratricopeptide (TPR) repeat protein